MDMAISYDQEWPALCLALQGIPPDPHSVDPMRFVELLKCHRLAAWFYTQIALPFWKSNQDTPLYQTLKRLFEAHQARSLFLVAERLHISREFLAHGIRCLHFKGVALSQHIYGDPSVRTSVDMDILISPSQLKLADKILKSKGYVRAIPPEIIFDKYFDSYHQINKEIVYLHPVKKVNLEIHGRLIYSPFWLNPSFDSMWQERSQIQFSGLSLQTLNPEFHFMYLCLHGSSHGFSRLQWLTDLADFIKKQKLNAHRLFELIDQYGLEGVVRVSMTVLRAFKMLPEDFCLAKMPDILGVGKTLVQHLNQYPAQNSEHMRLPLLAKLRFFCAVHPILTLLPQFHLLAFIYTFGRTKHHEWVIRHRVLNYGYLFWCLIKKKPVILYELSYPPALKESKSMDSDIPGI